MSRIQTLKLAAIAIVASLAGVLLARVLLLRDGPEQPVLATGTFLHSARPLPPLDFIDQEGKAFDAARLHGRWSILFFGFTTCPDVCPTTLKLLADVEQQLADLPPQQRPQVILVSVDPQRDTPAQLAAYVKYFSPAFTGITGSQSAVDEFTRQMGVPVAITQLDGGGYTVDHSASIFLVNPDGALQALFSPPHTLQALADDYRSVVTARSANE